MEAKLCMFLLVFVYLSCHWIYNYQEGKGGGIPLTGLTPPYFCSWPNPGPGFATSHSMVFVYIQWLEMRDDYSFFFILVELLTIIVYKLFLHNHTNSLNKGNNKITEL